MRFTIPAVIFAALVACGPTEPNDATDAGTDDNAQRALPGPSEAGGTGGLAEQELCDAIDYRILVGSNVDDTSFPVGPQLRVFGANDIITQDYIPQRTNVVHDNTREIIRVYCG
ncbi:MAG: hypothetical protein ACU0GG_06980 [Paracoccaceae bacterium]